MRSIAAFLALFAVACTTTAPTPVPSPTATEDRRALTIGEEATILALEDRREWNRDLASAWMAHPNAPHRERMAMALGRIGGAAFDDLDSDGVRGPAEPAAGVTLLIAAAGDPVFEVRRAIAFSLGEIGDARAVETLLRLAADEHADVASEAVEALSKMAEAVPFESVRSLATDPREGVRLRAIRFLFRFPEESATPLLRSLLESAQEAVRREATYSLSRRRAPAARDQLLVMLRDPDVLTRAHAARALGLLEDSSLLDDLLRAVRDPHPWVRINAARAISQTIPDTARVPPNHTIDQLFRLVALLRDPDPGVRAVALETVGPWLPLSDNARQQVITIAADGSRAEREIAAGVLARHLGVGSDSPAAALAATDDPWIRLRILEGAGAQQGAAGLRRRWAESSHALLRAGAVRAIPDEELDREIDLVHRGLADPDPIVRATAIGRFADSGATADEKWARLHEALERAASDELNDARLAALNALAAIDVSARRTLLEDLVTDADPVIARSAAEALAQIAGEDPAALRAFTPLRTRFARHHYERIAEWAREPKSATISTEKGDIRIALLTLEAPMTTWNFAELAGRGYFDGTTFMRVVPNFVIQGGDPRNDQSGGPGYAIRDEINLQKYTRGAVGMALSGPDTGGSQFFITHSPQPHLDGGYTIFGRVVEGMSVVDSIERGDRVKTITIHGGEASVEQIRSSAAAPAQTRLAGARRR